MTLLRIVEFLFAVIFIVFIVSAVKVIFGKDPGEKGSPKNEIKENVSAVLMNTKTGKRTVIRKRTLWERLTRRK